MAATRTSSSSHARRLAGAALIWLATASTGGAAIADDWTAIRGSYDQLRNYMSAKKVIGSEKGHRWSSSRDVSMPTGPRTRRIPSRSRWTSRWPRGSVTTLASMRIRGPLEADRPRSRAGGVRPTSAGPESIRPIPAILSTGSINRTGGGLLVARNHMARNRFQEAIDAIDAIPEDGLGKPGICLANRTRAGRPAGSPGRTNSPSARTRRRRAPRPSCS